MLERIIAYVIANVGTTFSATSLAKFLKNEKYYIADHGIREAVFGGNMRDINLILENIVYLELLRRGYEVIVGRTGEKEIDFVCDKHGEKLYVRDFLLAEEWN